MIRFGSLCALCAVLAMQGCQSAPTDAFAVAGRFAEEGRFLEALVILDRLPPSDEQYTQARTLAQALERRIRTSQEKVLQGLALRAQWRDEEAVRLFQEALDIWSQVAGARGLKTATENRIAALTEERTPIAPEVDAHTPVAEVMTSPIGEVTTRPLDSGETASPSPSGETGSPNDPGQSEAVQPSQLRVLRRRKLLGQAQRLLIRGEMDRALDILQDLWDETPGEQSIARQLVRVLHQRALLAYGQGRLEAAVDDWRKVLRLEEDNPQVAAFVRAANTELAARKRR